MYKIAFAFCFVLAVATGELSSRSLTRNDDYLHVNRLQFAKVIEYLDGRLKFFRDLFIGRVGVLDVQLEMVTDSVVQNENRLNPLEVLSDNHKRCVLKYRVKVPNLLETKTAIAACAAEATKELDPLLSAPLSTRDNLEAYYANDYKQNLKSCEDRNDISSANYTHCITAVTYEANAHTKEQRKIFETQLEAAECTAKATVKKAFDCSYNVESHTISSISEANVLIRSCLDGNSLTLSGDDECKPCQAYTCAESYTVTPNYNTVEMPNPFKGRDANTTCLMLNIQ